MPVTWISHAVLVLATALQSIAVAYAVVLLSRRRGGFGAWFFLLGGMLSMLVWRVFVTLDSAPPVFLNPLIGMWGSVCMLVAMVLFAREIARRERAEAERDQLLASERAARSQAERAARVKDEFLATLSHELRTPLTAILGWCGILRDQRNSPDIPRALAVIERNAQSQVRLVDELLDATRIQAGTLYLNLAPMRLDTPVRAAIEAIRPAATAKELSVTLVVSERPPRINGDTARIQQIANNLLTNAVKFTPRGGRIDVAVEGGDGVARLVVRDTGHGIAPEFLPFVFDRFRQADSTVARQHGGVGLGLAIALSLARLHKGELHAASDGPGQGATFTVTLPLQVNDAEAHSDSQTSPVWPELPALTGIRVVLVDDDADVRDVVKALLEERGAMVRALSSGDGIEMVLREWHPHLLLLDIGMPGEDGYSLIDRVRRLPSAEGGTIPAISLTAHARDEDRLRAMASGFQEHLPKPVDVASLVTAIRRHAVGVEG